MLKYDYAIINKHHHHSSVGADIIRPQFYGQGGLDLLFLLNVSSAAGNS